MDKQFAKPPGASEATGQGLSRTTEATEVPAGDLSLGDATVRGREAESPMRPEGLGEAGLHNLIGCDGSGSRDGPPEEPPMASSRRNLSLIGCGSRLPLTPASPDRLPYDASHVFPTTLFGNGFIYCQLLIGWAFCRRALAPSSSSAPEDYSSEYYG